MNLLKWENIVFLVINHKKKKENQRFLSKIFKILTIKSHITYHKLKLSPYKKKIHWSPFHLKKEEDERKYVSLSLPLPQPR